MALDGCGVVCKYILIFFNIIFALVGFSFLGLGLWLRFSDNTRGIFEIESLNSSAFVIGVTVLIALGSVMLIVVAVGDYGVCNEKRCALTVFSVLLTILAFADGVVGFLSFSKREELGLRMGEFYVSLYSLYVNSGDPALAVTLTFLHNMLQCCGMTGVSIIEIVKKTCPKSDGILSSIFMDSCPKVIVTVFDSKAPLVMGIFFGTGALLIIALICSATLAKKIRQAASAPQYIILAQSLPVPTSFQPPLHDFMSTSHPDPNPIVFTPLTVANIPAANIPVANIPAAQA